MGVVTRWGSLANAAGAWDCLSQSPDRCQVDRDVPALSPAIPASVRSAPRCASNPATVAIQGCPADPTGLGIPFGAHCDGLRLWRFPPASWPTSGASTDPPLPFRSLDLPISEV